jgi:hypothetical protein
VVRGQWYDNLYIFGDFRQKICVFIKKHINDQTSSDFGKNASFSPN